MKARPSDWLTFGVALTGSIIAIIGVVFLLNFTGDCAPDVTDSGEPQRRASFAVLGLAVVWLVYLVVRFTRSPTRFRESPLSPKADISPLKAKESVERQR